MAAWTTSPTDGSRSSCTAATKSVKYSLKRGAHTEPSVGLRDHDFDGAATIIQRDHVDTLGMIGGEKPEHKIGAGLMLPCQQSGEGIRGLEQDVGMPSATTSLR